MKNFSLSYLIFSFFSKNLCDNGIMMLTLIVLGILVETVKKSVLQAQSLRVQAKIGRIDQDQESERRKRRVIAMSCRLIILSWTK